MMVCKPLHTKMLRLDTCLFKYSSKESLSCLSCAQGLAIYEAVRFMGGEEITPIKVNPFNPGKKNNQDVNKRRAAALRYYHAHKVVTKVYLKAPYSPLYKTCPICGIESDMPRRDFYADARATDGLRPWCKRCEGQKRVENLKKRREGK